MMGSDDKQTKVKAFDSATVSKIPNTPIPSSESSPLEKTEDLKSHIENKKSVFSELTNNRKKKLTMK